MEYAHARYRGLPPVDRDREHAAPEKGQQQQHHQQESQQRFRFERDRDKERDRDRDRRPSSPPQPNGTPSTAASRATWRKEEKERAIASALYMAPKIGNGWPSSGPGKDTPAHPSMTVQNQRSRRSPPPALAPSAYGRDRPTFGNGHRPEGRDDAGPPMHHHGYQNGNRRMNGRPRSLSPPFLGARRGHRFGGGPGPSATDDDMLPYDEPQSSYSRQGTQHLNPSPRNHGGRPHDHGGPPHSRQPPFHPHKPDFQQRGWEASNDRERGLPSQYTDSDRERSMLPRPSYYENGGPPPSAFGKRARYDPEAFGKRGPSVDNGWAGARARGGARRRNGSPFSSVSEDGRRSRQVSGPTQFPAETEDGRHSERAVSPDRLSNSTSARSRGRRSPSPPQDPPIPPLRSPASIAGSSHSQSRSESDRQAGGLTSEREQLSLSARISGFPARTGPNGAGQHEDRFSAPPQTAHYAAFSGPRPGNRRDRPPLGRDRDELASRDSSPRSARSTSISQSPRLPHVLSQSVNGTNGRMAWGNVESRPRRASASPPRAPLSARQVASDFQSPRSLKDRLGPPADQTQMSTEQVAPALQRLEAEADQPEREEGEMRSEMEDDAMDEELGLTPPPRIPPSKLRPLAPPVKIEPELELEGQSGQLSAAVSKPMEAPQSSTLPESSAVGRQRRSGTPPGKSLRGMGPPASPRAPGPAPLASSAKTDQCSIHAAPSPLDCKVQPEVASPEAMRSPIKQEATALLSPKQENDRPNGQADAPLGSPSTASTTSPPPAVMRSAPTPARAPRTASQLEPLRAPAPLRQAMTPAVSDPSAGLPEKQDIDGIERSVASSSPPAQGVETANTSHDSTVVGLSMSMDGQKGPTSEGPSPAALEQRDDVEFAMTSEQVSVDEPLRAEEDGMQVEEDFDRTLLSIIELEDSRDDMELDPVDIIDDNRYRLGLTLPLAVPTVDDREGRFSVADPELGNYNLLEPFLHRSMEERDIRRGIRIVRLQQQYRELETEWRAHCKHLEKIQTRQKRRLAAAAPPLTPSIDASGLPFITTPATPSILAPSGRANRRAANTLGYSDAARSEAEFLEILARLEDADMADPNLRAMRTTATVPDMVIDAGERDLSSLQIYQDENGLVRDPLEHYGINKSPDNWTEDEIAIFCRRYALYPKQFGKIGAALPDKTTPQCVLFYYRSKKKIDFRALVDKRSRDGKRKKGKRGAGDKGADDAAAGQQKKGPSLLGNLKRSRVQEEEEEDEEDEPQTPGSAIAQESAVLSTAKALTRQLHGVIAPTDEPSDASGMALLSDALDSATPSAARLMPSRQPSYAKKAARFLSPPAAIDGGDESLVPASDGALAAAEALEVLANGLLDLGSAPAVGSAQGKTATTARQKKRKPSISDSAAMAAGSLVEEVASRPSTGTMGKRARPSTSSYWSVADKNEFTRLLRLHGKNFNGISEGLGSKTTIQCKNFFQNNAKKLGLFEIAAAVDGEDQGLTRASEVLIEELEMPSAFATPEESATSSHDQHPTAGYFVPVLEEEGHGEQYSLSGQKQGGMHLRHLLDDAPDAEGGATHPKPDLPYQKLASRPRVEDYDSSTEDEADLAGRLQQARRESATGSDLGAAEQLRAEDQLHHAHHQPPRTNGVSQQAGSYYNRTIYDDSNHSPDYTSRDQISPAYPTPLANERNFAGPLPPLKGRYAAFPPPRQWSPYDSRTIYSQATPSISSFYRSTSVGAMPAGAAPHMVSQAHEADYGDESRHFSPPPRTSFYRGQVAATEAEHENGRGLPPLISASAKGTASHYSPYYEAVATPPLYGPPSSSLRQSEGPENYADSSRRYDHYSAYRGQ